MNIPSNPIISSITQKLQVGAMDKDAQLLLSKALLEDNTGGLFLDELTSQPWNLGDVLASCDYRWVFQHFFKPHIQSDRSEHVLKIIRSCEKARISGSKMYSGGGDTFDLICQDILDCCNLHASTNTYVGILSLWISIQSNSTPEFRNSFIYKALAASTNLHQHQLILAACENLSIDAGLLSDGFGGGLLKEAFKIPVSLLCLPSEFVPSPKKHHLLTTIKILVDQGCHVDGYIKNQPPALKADNSPLLRAIFLGEDGVEAAMFLLDLGADTSISGSAPGRPSSVISAILLDRGFENVVNYDNAKKQSSSDRSSILLALDNSSADLITSTRQSRL